MSDSPAVINRPQCHCCGSSALAVVAKQPLCHECAVVVLNHAKELRTRNDELLAHARRDIAEGRGPRVRSIFTLLESAA